MSSILWKDSPKGKNLNPTYDRQRNVQKQVDCPTQNPIISDLSCKDILNEKKTQLSEKRKSLRSTKDECLQPQMNQKISKRIMFNNW